MRVGTTLTVIGLVAFVTTLDNNIVAAAVPSIARQLALDLPALQWITLGYLLPFAGLLLVAGTLLDRVGQRTMLCAGLLAFGAGAVAGGFARSAETLILARVAQGCGAAFLVPGTLSLLRTNLNTRQRAVGAAVWTAALAVALAIGPALGGWLSQYLHWSWIFFGNLPFVAVAFVLIPLCAQDSRVEGVKMDLAGMVTATIAMVAGTAALVGGGLRVPLAGVCVLASVGFILVERRAAAPIVPAALGREPLFTGGVTVQLLWGLGISGIFFFTPLMHQESLGLGPAPAGLPLLVVAVAIIAATPLVTPSLARFGPGPTVAAGLLVVAAGLFAVALVNAIPSIPPRIPGLILIGVGSAFTVPLTSSALEAVAERHAGVASGLLTASRELSSAVGVAVIGLVLEARRSSELAIGATARSALASGYSAGLVCAGCLELAAAALALRMLSRKRAQPSLPGAFG